MPYKAAPEKRLWKEEKGKNGEKNRLTKNPNTVVERDDNDIPVAGQNTAVNHVSGPLHVGASVDVHHYRFGPRISYVCKSGQR